MDEESVAAIVMASEDDFGDGVMSADECEPADSRAGLGSIDKQLRAVAWIKWIVNVRDINKKPPLSLVCFDQADIPRKNGIASPRQRLGCFFNKSFHSNALLHVQHRASHGTEKCEKTRVA